MNLTVMIPPSGELLVKTGQNVDFTTPFIRVAQSRRVALPIAQVMKFSPHKIFHTLKKGVGDTVQKGDLLAQYKTMLTTKEYFSDIPGTIMHIDHKQGTVVIEEQTSANALEYCFFTGEIESMDHRSINIKVQKTHAVPLASRVQHSGGSVYYVSNISTDFTEDDIANNYIITNEIDLMQSAKLGALGARAVILPRSSHTGTSLEHIVLQHEGDFKHIMSHKYPYCMVAPEQDSLIFYS